jgi:hypothetical protein
VGALRELAERTPASRERYVDLLRAVALGAVVLGHWLVSVVGYDEQGRLTGQSALPALPWAFPITWVVQVMPLFFIVGGYANAASLAAHRQRGGTAITWLQARTERLVRPTTALVLVLAAAALLARAAHPDPALARFAVWVAAIPLWFLSAYLVVVAATPLMYRLHQRFGWWVVVVLVVLVALGDLARLGGQPRWGMGSFVFGWLAIHQVGFAWRDGRIQFRPRTGVPLLIGGLGAVIALTVAGPYPTSMIDIPGQRLLNASPPTLALLATTVFQLGLLVLLRGPATRWLHRPKPWRTVVAVNSIVFTVFLWHMSAAVLLVGLLDGLHRLPTPPVATAHWWLWRPPWLLMLTVVLAALVAIFGRLETRRRPAATVPAQVCHTGVATIAIGVLTVASYGLVIAGLLANSLAPNRGDYLAGMPTGGLVAYLAGAAILRRLRRR